MQQDDAYQIAVLPGDGIGPEVMREAVRVLEAAASAFGLQLSFARYAIGGSALDHFDEPFPKGSRDACMQADAVLLGAIGGPKWDHEKGDRRCESALLSLRKSLRTFANLRPVTVPESLANSSPLRRERVAGVDILIVRELTGGIYFGEPRFATEQEGGNMMRYTRSEVERIARVAFQMARRRSGLVTSVDKANVLQVSQFWREVISEVHTQEFPDLDLRHLYVDNAAMQLVLNPGQFDVIVTANLFGDILSDLAATLPGSLGLLPSASIGGSVGLFEPVHGSAPDLAGQGLANPLGAILSGAMLLDQLGHGDAAAAIRNGVTATLDAGIKTGDLGGVATTHEVGALVAERVSATKARTPMKMAV